MKRVTWNPDIKETLIKRSCQCQTCYTCEGDRKFWNEEIKCFERRNFSSIFSSYKCISCKEYIYEKNAIQLLFKKIIIK